MRILYRTRQFWQSVFLKTEPKRLEQVRGRFNTAQWALFTQLQPEEQAHALRIFYKLLEQGDDQPDLLLAALLHDVGKLKYPLNPLERAIIVLVRATLPKQASQWGSLPHGDWESFPGLRKAFILAENHAQWGADLARQAGVSPLTEALIRDHQHSPPIAAGELENSLLHKLQVLDNDN
ncbi:MAG TPA: HD domain-containing protein [Anaerolineales bacterium]|nr:HD domain-containing protein [Anaerolineales bacterium]